MSDRVLTEVAEQLLQRHPINPFNEPCQCFRCCSLRDLLDSRARVKELEGLCRIADGRFFSYEQHIKRLEKWRDAVLSIVDSLDDPYRGNSWQEVTQELCARELEHLRSVLVPLVPEEER